MDEYQNRRDIDKIYDVLYDQISGSLNVLTFMENSPYRNIASKDDGSDRGTIDAIIDYYDLTSKGGGGGDLSNYYTKTEINGILSSYVTNQTLEDYALKSELFSGSYEDLTDVPSSFPPSTHSHNWDSITDKPSSFPPSSHNHTTSQITDLSIPTKTSDLTNDGDGTNVFVKNNDSRLSDARTPTSHTHTKSNITDFAHSHLPTEVSDDSSDYPNIYRYSLPSTPSTIKATLGAIDIALGSIVKLPPFEIVSVLPTASDDTMGKLYFLLSNNKVDVYYTERSGTWESYSYSWQELELNIAWSDIQSKPSDFPPSSHTHDDRYYTESEINSAMLNKQDRLVSQVNIKSINGNSLMGSGDLAVGDVTQNVVTEWSDPVTDGHIPSERLVYNSLATKASWAHTHYSHDITDLIDVVYPVGSIYMSVSDVNPATLFGVGTWEKIEDKFLLSSGTTYTPTYDSDGFANKTGGEATHTLTKDEMPSHTHEQNPHHHTFGHYQNNGSTTTYSASWGNQKTANANTSDTTATNKNTGGGRPHNNMPPYLVVNMWKRTV